MSRQQQGSYGRLGDWISKNKIVSGTILTLGLAALGLVGYCQRQPPPEPVSIVEPAPTPAPAPKVRVAKMDVYTVKPNDKGEKIVRAYFRELDRSNYLNDAKGEAEWKRAIYNKVENVRKLSFDEFKNDRFNIDRVKYDENCNLVEGQDKIALDSLRPGDRLVLRVYELEVDQNQVANTPKYNMITNLATPTPIPCVKAATAAQTASACYSVPQKAQLFRQETQRIINSYNIGMDADISGYTANDMQTAVSDAVHAWKAEKKAQKASKSPNVVFIKDYKDAKPAETKAENRATAASVVSLNEYKASKVDSTAIEQRQTVPTIQIAMDWYNHNAVLATYEELQTADSTGKTAEQLIKQSINMLYGAGTYEQVYNNLREKTAA